MKTTRPNRNSKRRVMCFGKVLAVKTTRPNRNTGDCHSVSGFVLAVKTTRPNRNEAVEWLRPDMF